MNIAVPEQYFRILEQGFNSFARCDYEEGVKRGLEARELAPERTEALYLLGLGAWRLSRHINALDLFLEGHRLAPNTSEFSTALAHLYAHLGKLADSLYYIKLSQTQLPDGFLSRFVPPDLLSANAALQGAGFAAYFHHATLAFDAQDYARAEELCQSELAITPENIACLHLYGRVLIERGQALKAASALRGAIAGGQNDAATYAMLARALCNSGDFAAAVDAARDAVRREPDDRAVLLAAIHALDALPSGMDGARAELVALWRKSTVAEPLPLDAEAGPFPGRALRVGYLINDAAAEGSLEELDAVLTCHNTDRVEVFAYQLFMHNPTATNRLRSKVPNWRELADVDDLSAAYILAGDALDVLVDVSPLGMGARPALLAARPAPLQIGWHGEFSDDVIDAVLADAAITAGLPEGTRVVAMSNGTLVRPVTPFAQAVSQAMSPPCEVTGTITFGARFDLARIIPSVATWARILRGRPGSTLMLGLTSAFEHQACDRLYELFASYGVADQVSLAHDDADDGVSFWSKIDILLTGLAGPVASDMVEALIAGVPVVARGGVGIAHARAASVLNAVGQENWLAGNDDNYVSIALSMARSAETAASLRRELLRVTAETPLCSARGFTNELEAALAQAYLLRGN